MSRLTWLRLDAVLALTAGTVYVVWRWGFSVRWANWWIAVPLVVAETYALIDGYLFATTIWRMKVRGEPPAPPEGATVDVFITTYNEPVDMVMATARAAQRITYPHRTWTLDDGDRSEMRLAAKAAGIDYITRTADWAGLPRHAKAGNLNNALFHTHGEFILILDADQIPEPNILDRTLGWFEDSKMALVQTPQWFSNVTDSDPLGSQSPLFYGPIQQGKDGWNAAFFCGSNAIIRREALMQIGIVNYVREVDASVRAALATSRRILDRTARRTKITSPETAAAIAQVRSGVDDARRELDEGEPLAQVTHRFQQVVSSASRSHVEADLASIRADLAELAELEGGGAPWDSIDEPGPAVLDEASLDRFAQRDWTPIGAIESVAKLMRAVDVDRKDEAQPIMPMSTVSVTEDMATCMRLHAAGWKTAFHHEILARGLAPEDLRTMLQQRLRWAQGTLQVMLRENPLTIKGLNFGQRLMYFATMWSYLAGFAALPFLFAPIIYLTLGVLPVKAFGLTFVAFFTPYFLLNQLLFFSVGYGTKTWRGQQYSLALFPIWIKACVSAARNVWFGHPLPFVVTPKTQQRATTRFPVQLIWPQLAVMALLVLAVATGVVRVLTGNTVTVIGVTVNTIWVAYDLIVLSVIIQAAFYRAPDREAIQLVR